MATGQRLYEYGWIAWVWRVLMSVGLFLGGGAFVLAFRSFEVWLLVAALALLAPILFFGTVLVVTMDRRAKDVLDVQTLLFVRRRIAVNDLGPPRVRVRYRSVPYDFSAPRVWVPVRGAAPLYFDLLGRIPDRPRFLATIRLKAAELDIAD